MEEILIISTGENDEQKTINRYHKLGWHLIGERMERPGSFVRKLTFARDTDAPNFEKLDAYYRQFCINSNRKQEIEQKIEKAAFSVCALIISLIVLAAPCFYFGVLFYGYLSFEFVLEDPGFLEILERDFWIAVFMGCSFLCVDAFISLFVGFFAGLLNKNRLKKQFESELQTIEYEMDVLTDKASRYLK